MVLDGIIAQLPSNILIDVILMIIVATVVAFFTHMIRQPLIPAYVLTGILLGPSVFGLVKNYDAVLTLSEIGIAFLLFVVGLEMDFRKLKEVGWVASLGGLIQVALTFFVGYAVSVYFGFTELTAAYVGLVLAFSSTMVVVKLLSDRDELQTLHGRIALGILIMQDFIVVFVLAILGEVNTFSAGSFLGVLVKAGLFLVLCMISLKYVLPGVFKISTRNKELMFLMSITACFLFAIIALEFGFSIVVGAFLAGLMLGNLPYYVEITKMVKPLRDFFATLFFIALGMQLDLGSLGNFVKPLIYFLLIVLLIKPFIIFLITILFGYEKKTSFLSGMALGQISEFSLVLVALGLQLGHVNHAFLSLTVLLAVVSITLTSYVMNYQHHLYKDISKALVFFEKFSFVKQKALQYVPEKNYHFVLFGGRRMAPILIEKLKKTRKNALIVDYDPDAIKKYIEHGIPCLYGDMSNEDLLKKAKVNKAKVIISTVLTKDDNIFLLEHAKAMNKKATIIVSAATAKTALEMYERGADYVIVPHLLSGEFIVRSLFKAIENHKKLYSMRHKHVMHLLSMATR